MIFQRFAATQLTQPLRHLASEAECAERSNEVFDNLKESKKKGVRIMFTHFDFVRGRGC